ncbi:MAG TPA: putative Ig domain-containing protein, partial [Acidobacteriota bacterium]|nr:putative Ig domain-containing protein [Acidobacteriota bacterium]
VVDSLGQVTVAGITESTDFPVHNARQAVSAGDADGFVARLNAAGTALVYSSYVGGSRGDVINAVTIDTQGAIYLTGSTESEDFPTQGPMQIQMGGQRDAFVTKLNPANPPQTQLVYSAFVGGSDMEVGLAIAVQSGNVYLAGSTRSSNFPTVIPLQPTYGGSNGFYGDAFVVAINSSGTQVLSSTYLGGEGEDVATGIAVLNGRGDVIITGQTKSTSFPLKSAFQSTIRGESDGFVARLFESRSLTYASYLGGDGNELYNGIASAGPDHYYITGQTSSAVYPGADPVDPLERRSDLVVVHVGETGAGVLPGIRDVTRLGGSGNDASESIAVDGSGNIYLGGRTRSADFPILGPVQDTFGGGTQDAFVMKYRPCTTLTLSPATVPQATFESSYVQPFTASGGAEPYRFLITYGGLPAGMTLTEDGSLSGVPVQPGEFLFTLTAIDQTGCNTSRTYNFTVTCGNFTVTPDSLPLGAVNNTYTQTLSVTGGVGPYTFGLKSGTVPPGIELSPDGIVTGTPTVVGNYLFTIRITDSRGCFVDKVLNLVVAACPTFTFEPSGSAYLLAPPGVPF